KLFIKHHWLTNLVVLVLSLTLFLSRRACAPGLFRCHSALCLPRLIRGFFVRERRDLATALIIFTILPVISSAQSGETSIDELKRLSLEELFELPVTSVTRSEHPIGASASAIYVIREEMIQSSAYTTLGEVLRLAPNLHVAQRSSNSFSITARGFRPDSS